MAGCWIGCEVVTHGSFSYAQRRAECTETPAKNVEKTPFRQSSQLEFTSQALEGPAEQQMHRVLRALEP